MISDFWNRTDELAKIRECLGKGAFGYVTGRRRVGKTAVLLKACEQCDGFYHQAVEGTPAQQLLHLSEELGECLPLFRDVVPKTWGEFFALLSRETLPPLIVFDEFPYWVQGDSTLPSLLQKWIDHELPKQKSLVLVSGSSQSMLHAQFLSHSSPLFGRALLHLHLKPMSFAWFCRALKYPINQPSSFERYALVGGIPHYWKMMPKVSLIRQAETLYFQSSSILSEEPRYLLQDEGITGTLPKAILDLVGRGVAKPSELGSRLGTVQGNLSRPLALLLELGLLHRELPFGESSRTTKKVLYSLEDAALSFYYRNYLPTREHWKNFNVQEKETLLRQHATYQWEIFCRSCYPGSSRYWEGDVEIDLVYLDRETKRHQIAECKWTLLSKKKEKELLDNLRHRFSKTTLGRKIGGKTDYRIFSKTNLSELAKI